MTLWKKSDIIRFLLITEPHFEGMKAKQDTTLLNPLIKEDTVEDNPAAKEVTEEDNPTTKEVTEEDRASIKDMDVRNPKRPV